MPRPFLLISYFYPPFQSVGALRVSKLSKHLPRFGWQPTILTVANDTAPATMPVEVPAEWIHRARMLDVNILPKLVLGRKRIAEQGFWSVGSNRSGRLLADVGRLYRDLVNFPDGQIGWFPFALSRAVELVHTVRPELIYTSSMPATAHLLGAVLARRFGIPWIAEFRDPWTDGPAYNRSSPLAAIERRLEAMTLAGAKAIVGVTPQTADWLGKRFGRPSFLVPNGFDPEDALNDTPLTPEFTMTFTGMVYPGKQTLQPLFAALAELRRQGEVPPGFSVRLIGRHVAALGEEASAAGVADLVKVMPQLSRRESLRLQAESTVLLLPLWTDEQQGSWYPAKMFEYMASRRPILAVGPQSNEAARLLTSRSAGWVASTPSDVIPLLRGWFSQASRGGTSAIEPGVLLDEYRRERCVERLAHVFDAFAPASNSDGAI